MTIFDDKLFSNSVMKRILAGINIRENYNSLKINEYSLITVTLTLSLSRALCSAVHVFKNKNLPRTTAAFVVSMEKEAWNHDNIFPEPPGLHC